MSDGNEIAVHFGLDVRKGFFTIKNTKKYIENNHRFIKLEKYKKARITIYYDADYPEIAFTVSEDDSQQGVLESQV